MVRTLTLSATDDDGNTVSGPVLASLVEDAVKTALAGIENDISARTGAPVPAVKTDDYLIGTAPEDKGRFFVQTGTGKHFILANAFDLGAGYFCWIHAVVDTDIATDPTRTQTINGVDRHASALAISAGTTVMVVCNGTKFFVF